jgi:N-acetylmuramic acid 6-phosphate (MurNAc-6-P) etherase
MGSILQDLKITPSPQSIDFVTNKKQFHLHHLLTEQRHPKTMNLSSVIGADTRKGLQMLLSVDDDITYMIERLLTDLTIAEQVVEALADAMRNGRKIYFYGCGATGRLAKQMESTFWRPFWKRMKESMAWVTIKGFINEDIASFLIGEMTGADRAMISSLEGFEDLQVIGRLQLADRGIQKGDVVICVSEGGETSSVIGTILAAREQYGEMNEVSAGESRKNLYFVYNNPDNLLLPIDRSRLVIEDAGITKLNLATGPQAITGSTRMQATTSETFVLGVLLEEAMFRVLCVVLTDNELSAIGFDPEITLTQRFLSFKGVKAALNNSIDSLAGLTAAETDVYQRNSYCTYFAKKALSTVFIDGTERSPTFRLFPVDTIDPAVRKSWIQVWTEAINGKEAWRVLLGREFRGLKKSVYYDVFSNEIDDSYLRESALRSLDSAGNDQEMQYDLSFSGFNIRNRGPAAGDLGVAVCVNGDLGEWSLPESSFRQFCSVFRQQGAKVAVIFIGCDISVSLRDSVDADVKVVVEMPCFPDPLGLRSQLAVKMLLNAHSTAVMAKMGRISGNTMTSVNPGNLKLIGRATHLIQLHVNETIESNDWIVGYGIGDSLTFEEANAVLFDEMENGRGEDGSSEVTRSIERIMECKRRMAGG